MDSSLNPQNEDKTSTNTGPSTQTSTSHMSGTTPNYYHPPHYPPYFNQSHSYSNQPQSPYPYPNQHNTNNNVPPPTNLVLTFKRNSPPKSSKQRQLLQAIKKFDGMKGHEVITIVITKTGDVESDTEDSDDNDSGIEIINTKKRNKENKNTKSSKTKRNSNEQTEQDIRKLLEYTLKNAEEKK
eukprot:281679_1